MSTMCLACARVLCTPMRSCAGACYFVSHVSLFAQLFFLCFEHFLIISSGLCIPSRSVSCRQAPAMDARTQKRIASVQHIKQKLYYRPLSQEPDPLDEGCSTRAWKYAMKVWVETLKKNAFNEGQSQHADAAPDVMTGSL